MQTGFAPILIILLIALGIGGYFIYINYSNNNYKTPVQNIITNPQPTTLPSTNNAETANWKAYTDQGTKTIFKYPNWRILEEKVDNSALRVRFEILGSEYNYERVYSNNIPEDLESATKVLNKVKWNFAKGKLKYKCATDDCAIHYTIHDGYLYSLYGPIDTIQLQEKLLSTFKFNN